MAAVLVVVMAAMVTQGQRQRHALLVELVGRASLRQARGSLGGGLSLGGAGGRLQEGVVRGPVREEALGTTGEGQGGVQAVVVGGRRGGGAAAAEGPVGAHSEDVGVGALVQGQLPVPLPVGQAQPPHVAMQLRLPLGDAVREHVLVGVLAAQLEVLRRGGGGERGGRGGRGLEVADQAVALAHQAQLALGQVVCEQVPTVWMRVCIVGVQVVFADVVQVPQVGAGVAAGLRGAHGVQAGVAAQLGEAGAAVAGPGGLRAASSARSIERSGFVLPAAGTRGREQQ